MQTQFYVRAVDVKTGEETVTERVRLERVAHDYAWKWAEEFYGGDDATWIEDAGAGTLRVGRILEDGTRSESLVTITVEEVVTDEDPPELTWSGLAASPRI